MADLPQTITAPSLDAFNVQGKKYYVFNQTGNVMMSSTDPDGKDIPESVRDVFAEVSVFFAAMTKAISQTPNPRVPYTEGEEPTYYNLYNYDALEAIIDGSGYFVHVTEQDVKYKVENYGATFSQNLITSLLGIALGSGALSFASSMINSMGKEAISINSKNTSSSNKVANLIFICEYIMGMPLVSVMVVTADSKKNVKVLNAGPCFKASSETLELIMHKDVYMFVTPHFIKQFASELNTEMNNPDYLELIDHLQSLVERKPYISGIANKNGIINDGKLKAGEQYSILGEYLGRKGTLTLLDRDGEPFAEATDNPKISAPAWNNHKIGEFQITYAKADSPIVISIQIEIEGTSGIYKTPSFTLEPSQTGNNMQSEGTSSDSELELASELIKEAKDLVNAAKNKKKKKK